MSQILFLDPPVNISNLILKKKIFVKNGFFWKILAFFGKKWSKIGVPRTKTTSSSSKFCADSKTARLFGPRTVTLLENRVFVSQGGTKIQLFRQNRNFLQIIAQNRVKKSTAQDKTYFIFCEILSGFQKYPTFLL